MFRKATLLAFISLYLISTTGFAMNLHFCGTKLANIQFNNLEPKSCCASKSAEADKCCKNQFLKIKVSDEHQTIVAQKFPAISSIHLFNVSAVLKNTWINSENTATNLFIKPPPPAVSLGLIYCVFRI